jgi:hypothetical protein
MDNDDPELVLRRQSVRTLTEPELSRANGGVPGTGTGTGSCYGSGCTGGLKTTRTK